MKKIIQYIIFLLVFGNTSWGQTYVKTYGIKGKNEEAIALATLNDGGAIVVGNSNSNTNDGGQDGLILRIDNIGNIKWQKNFSANKIGKVTYEWLYWVIVDEANDVVYSCGQSSPSNSPQDVKRLPWVLKTKLSSGQLIWSKTYIPKRFIIGKESTNPIDIKDSSIGGYANSIRSINTNSVTKKFMITGVINNENGYQNVGGLILTINDNGDLVSNAVNNFYETQKSDNGHLSMNNTIESTNNNFYGVGNATLGSSNYDPIAFEFDQSGKIIKYRRYNWNIDNDGIYTINWSNSINNSNLLLSGHYRGNNTTATNTQGKLSFLNIGFADLALNTLNTYQIKSSPTTAVNSPKCRVIDNNGSRQFISPIQVSGSTANMGFIIVNGLGEKQSDKFIGTSSEDVCNDVAQTSDGGFLMIGTTKYFDNGPNKDILIIKVEKSGEIKDLPSCFSIIKDTMINVSNNDTTLSLEVFENPKNAIRTLEFNTNSINQSLKDTTCPPPPCLCPPAQEFKLEVYDGRPKTGGKIITTLQSGASFQGQCFKNYFFYSRFNCPDNCNKSDEVIIVTPTKDTILSNNHQFDIKGNWQVIVYPKCGDKVCEIIKYTISIPNCDCPPPDCCKEKLEFGDNGLMKVVAKADGTTVNISGTMFGSSTEGYREVRISVLDVLIQSENKNAACISCLTNPKQWASIGKSYINKFTPANEAGDVNNPREVRFTATNAVKLDGVNYGFNILLPPPSTLECCKLSAIIVIKITLRDNQCRECDYIYTTTVPFETKTYGGQDNGTSSQGSGSTSSKKTPDLFSGCNECLPIKNFQGSRIIKD